jgi:hypothetical protein
MASTEKANWAHSTKIKKLISTFCEENKGAAVGLGKKFKEALLRSIERRCI